MQEVLLRNNIIKQFADTVTWLIPYCHEGWHPFHSIQCMLVIIPRGQFKKPLTLNQREENRLIVRKKNGWIYAKNSSCQDRLPQEALKQCSFIICLSINPINNFLPLIYMYWRCYSYKAVNSDIKVSNKCIS